MEEPITTEVEYALVRMHPDFHYAQPAVTSSVVLEEREKNTKCARGILDTFYDVSREFIQIELGIID